MKEGKPFTVLFSKSWLTKGDELEVDQKDLIKMFQVDTVWRWIAKNLFGCYTVYNVVATTDPKQILGGFEYDVKLVSKYKVWFWYWIENL